MKKLFLCICLTCVGLISKGQNHSPFKRLDSYSPSMLMEVVSRSGNGGHGVLTVVGDFPSKSVSLTDVKKLIPKIKGISPCLCLLSPISSILPDKNQTANVGGYAILLINAYRTKSDIKPGLYKCPTTNQKDVAEILTWWKALK